jgi:arylsulfatase
LGDTPAELEFRFEYDGGGIGKGGTMTIHYGDRLLAQGRIERTISIPAGLGETMDTGRDTGVPVARAKTGQVPFEGTIHEIRINTGRVKVL